MLVRDPCGPAAPVLQSGFRQLHLKLAEVNMAFNATLLWQFVGVLFTPVGSQDQEWRLSLWPLKHNLGGRTKRKPQEGMRGSSSLSRRLAA